MSIPTQLEGIKRPTANNNNNSNFKKISFFILNLYWGEKFQICALVKGTFKKKQNEKNKKVIDIDRN